MQDNYRPAMELAQARLRALDPRRVAGRSGVELLASEAGQQYQVRLLGQEYHVPIPEARVYNGATGLSAGTSVNLVVLHYLSTADGSPITGNWVPFRSLPGGNVYEQAFRQQCLRPLIDCFGSDPEGFERAGPALGGEKAAMGDHSFVFRALPHLSMACVLWLADEEQGAEANLLYDVVAPSYLHTEDLASLGRMLAFGLIKAGGKRS